ncbi:MAG: translation elongation factor Ts [Rectinema sp.]|uniref:Elongation factor Ts n=1 Tax=uncultured spirochete TaxID=156406 RepID=A0A3P3XUE2_9SPIR|nr:Elongation factor Ts [uncultured spirochete]
MEIKATDVKALREKTGAGMMDCKKALNESQGDFGAAEKLLREWGMAGVEKRAGRATNEGRIFVAQTENELALVELACETDFVARNTDFINVGTKIAETALQQKASGPNEGLEARVKEIASLIKENIALKRVAYFSAGMNETLHTYLHGEGRIGVVVKFRANDPAAFKNEKVAAFVHDIALHVAAFNPMFLDESKVPQAWLSEQKEIFQKQVEMDEKMKSKPAKVLEGILAGKLKKLLAEVCLVDQGFVRDEKIPVAAALEQVAKETGYQLAIVEYYFAKVGQN